MKTEYMEEVKSKILDIATESFKKGHIDEQTFENIKNIVNKSYLNIAIVGQMKYGKSTFLNALLFGKPVLPTSDTPMTAALTTIEYGEKESYTVEFMTEEEVKKILKYAEELEKSENPDKALSKFKSNYNRYRSEFTRLFGTQKDIPLDQLHNYVGAEGRYTPITKMVKIKLPYKNLKSVRVVDTPGFNDPIESRSQRAEEFLSEADIIIAFLYAGRPFDSNDKEIITQKLVSVGAGKLILVLNKIDDILEEEGTLQKVENSIDNALEKSIEEIENEHIKKIFKEIKKFSISALWALLGKMDKKDIENDEDLLWYFEEHKDKFPFLRTQEDFLEKSNISSVENYINQVIKDEKVKTLVRKASTQLLGSIEKKKMDLEGKKLSLLQEENLLSKDKEEIRNRIEEFTEFERNEFPKIVNDAKIYREIDDIISNKEKELSDLRYTTYNNIVSKIGKPGLIDLGGYKSKVNRIMSEYLTEMKHKAEEILRETYEESKNSFIEWLDRVSDNLLSNDIVKKYTNYSYGNYSKLIKNIYNNLDLGEVNTTQKKMIGAQWLTIFGRKDEAVMKANTIADKNCKLFYNSFRNKIEDIKIKFNKIHVEKVKDDLLRFIIRPIQDSLIRVEEENRDSKNRLMEIREELKNIEEKLKNIENTKNIIENKLSSLEV